MMTKTSAPPRVPKRVKKRGKKKGKKEATDNWAMIFQTKTVRVGQMEAKILPGTGIPNLITDNNN